MFMVFLWKKMECSLTHWQIDDWGFHTSAKEGVFFLDIGIKDAATLFTKFFLPPKMRQRWPPWHLFWSVVSDFLFVLSGLKWIIISEMGSATIRRNMGIYGALSKFSFSTLNALCISLFFVFHSIFYSNVEKKFWSHLNQKIMFH